MEPRARLSIDVREGGTYRMSFTNFSGGGSHTFGGKYLEVVPGEKLVYTDAFDDPNIEADLATFNTTFHLPPCTTANGCFKKIYATGTKPPSDTTGWAVEIALDVEWAHAIAPAAKIILVESANNTNNALYLAVDVAVQNGASVVSMSWGGTEFRGEDQLDYLFTTPTGHLGGSSGLVGSTRLPGGVAFLAPQDR